MCASQSGIIRKAERPVLRSMCARCLLFLSVSKGKSSLESYVLRIHKRVRGQRLGVSITPGISDLPLSSEGRDGI